METEAERQFDAVELTSASRIPSPEPAARDRVWLRVRDQIRAEQEQRNGGGRNGIVAA